MLGLCGAGGGACATCGACRGKDGLAKVLGLRGGNDWGLGMLGIVVDDGAGEAWSEGEKCAGALNGRVGTGTPGGRYPGGWEIGA